VGNAFGGCKRRYVRVDVTAGGRAGGARVGCTALEVRLERPLEPGASARAYARWFGPYDRDELDLVEGPSAVARGAGIGMEYPELVLTPPQAIVVHHEVAHQWWHGIVGNDEYAEPWLDESFATYAGVRLTGGPGRCEPPRGRPRLTASMKIFGRRPGGDSRRVVYIGGMCALTTLERRLGRARFDRMMRGVVEEHRDGILTTERFVAAVRAAAPPGVDAGALLRRVGIVPG
jgi:Peptidase family M1 domain